MAACHAMSHAPGAGQRHLEHPRAQACVRGTTHSTRSSILRGGHPVQNSEGTPDEPDCGSGRRCIAWSACRISTIWAELEMLLPCASRFLAAERKWGGVREVESSVWV